MRVNSKCAHQLRPPLASIEGSGTVPWEPRGDRGTLPRRRASDAPRVASDGSWPRRSLSLAIFRRWPTPCGFPA